ncbi:MAG: lipoate protein ligase C-terminal domain-containing protein [Candidatus Thermoplasmatota archaeon]|nr:lipoate protein ligase C-terminal domain-containing protein [Candidatus Thermoplasmatota archaeon]
MQLKSIYKVPNGKLLKIFLDYNSESNVINNISITGDFFVYPEESIDIIEKKLKDTLLIKDDLLEEINHVIKKYNIEFIGLDAESLVEGIIRCVK